MTRVSFDDGDEFITWFNTRSRPYEVYHTKYGIYAVPTVSTRPVVYGVLTIFSDRTDVLPELNIDSDDVYRVDEFYFDETRSSKDS